MNLDLSGFYTVVETLFLLMVCGFVARKIGFITDESSKGLSKLIVKLAQPFMIIHAIATAEPTVENLNLAWKVVLVGICVHTILCGLAYVSCKWIKDLNQKKICEFAMVFANCGFLGLPVLEALFGAKGLFMGGFYIISFHLFVWTWGISIFARGRDDIKLTWKNILVNYGTVPVTIGLCFYLLCFIQGFYLPACLTKFGGYLSGLCTPISMLITGALIATKPLKNMFTNIKLYFVCVLKLLVFPIVICLLACLFQLSEELVILACIMAAFPTASMCSMLAEMYDVSPDFAGQEVGLTSLLSCATLPLVVLIARELIQLFA